MGYAEVGRRTKIRDSGRGRRAAPIACGGGGSDYSVLPSAVVWKEYLTRRALAGRVEVAPASSDNASPTELLHLCHYNRRSDDSDHPYWCCC